MIRPADNQDIPAIKLLLIGTDEYYPALAFTDFWVMEEDGKIRGTLQLRRQQEHCFLSSLAVSPDHQQRGLAGKLLQDVLGRCRQPVYLYTIIPDFFARFGFTITSAIPGLPAKDDYQCAACRPDRCVTMVRRPDAV